MTGSFPPVSLIRIGQVSCGQEPDEVCVEHNNMKIDILMKGAVSADAATGYLSVHTPFFT
jgi:hypothetical protein